MATDAKPSAGSDPLAPFSAPVRRWFEASFEGPTPAQAGGWEAISSGANTLICAPTGSGKTLASFLWGIDRLSREAASAATGVRLVYVSPLKALSYDIERNLRAPLRGIGADISVGLRTGDTPQTERRAMQKTPPDILITTPESLYLMLSSAVREIFATTEAVIVDEIHAVAQSQAGVAPGADSGAARAPGEDHAGGSGSCRSRPAGARASSATPHATREMRRAPADRSLRDAAAAGADRSVPGRAEARVRDRRCGVAKELDLEIVVPVEDMAEPGAPAFPSEDGNPAEGEPLAHVRSIWPAIYPELLKLVQEHTSTIIFVNNRRAAERLAKRLNELANGEGEQELPATEQRGQCAWGGWVGSVGNSRRRPVPTDPTQPPPSRSPAPTTGRSPTRSARSSRRC